MTSIQKICDDLKGMDGTVGAFVWSNGTCLASSLPKNYDTARLEQTGSELLRLSQLAGKASYSGCSFVFHWQRALLFSWGLSDDSVLAVLALTNAPRGVVELSASMAIEELRPILAQGPVVSLADPLPSISLIPVAAPKPPEAARPASTSEESTKLRELEELVVSELGPTGRVLFTRARQKSYRTGLPESDWLPKLRTAVLADLGDPSAWAGIAASVLWLPDSD